MKKILIVDDKTDSIPKEGRLVILEGRIEHHKSYKQLTLPSDVSEIEITEEIRDIMRKYFQRTDIHDSDDLFAERIILSYISQLKGRK